VQEIYTYIQPKPALNRFERNRAFKRQMHVIIGNCLKTPYGLLEKENRREKEKKKKKEKICLALEQN